MLWAWAAISACLLPFALHRTPPWGRVHAWHSDMIGPLVMMAVAGQTLIISAVAGAIEVPKDDMFRMILASLAAAPFELALFLVLDRLASPPARFAEIHEPFRVILTRMSRLWWAATPAVFGVHYLFTQFVPPQDHPFIVLLRESSAGDRALIAARACVAAPILEEFLFRGILLPWLARGDDDSPLGPLGRRIRARLIVGVSLVFVLKETPHDADFARRAGPILFWLISAACVEFLPRWRGLCRRIGLTPPIFRAVMAQALLFGAVHLTWPSPVPLFLLGIVLGWLTVRTRSVWPAMLFHALFNLVSTAAVVFGG